jgi:hypothetical protein
MMPFGARSQSSVIANEHIKALLLYNDRHASFEFLTRSYTKMRFGFANSSALVGILGGQQANCGSD